MRILNFADSFESGTPPTLTGFSAEDVAVDPSGNLSSTDAQSAFEELQSDIDSLALQSDLTAHIDETEDAHNASAISTVPLGTLSADNVQDAVDELQNDIDVINGLVGQPDGIATLDSDGKIPFAQVPAIALVEVYVVADIAARDALTVEEGDVAVVTDAGSGVKKTYIYDGSSWVELISDGSLASHLSDTSGAHAASAISNTPSGNLAATDVQAALNEIQTDVDTRALSSDLTAHLSDTTDAHDASAISIVPSGNISSTNVQDALNELQDDIDDINAASSGYVHTAVTANHTADYRESIVSSGSAHTITLPDATGNEGQVIRHLHNGSNFVKYSFHTTSSQTILHNGVTYSDTDINTDNKFASYTAGEFWEFESIGASGWKVTIHKSDTGVITLSTIPITSTSAHIFTISSSSVTAGAVYTVSGNTYIVSLTISSQTTLTCAGFGNPSASGTLTKVSGTGPSTISYSAVTNSQPTKGNTTTVDEIRVQRVGGDKAEFWFLLNVTNATGGATGTGDYLLSIEQVGSFAAAVPISLPTATGTGTQANSGTYLPYRIPASGLAIQAGTNFVIPTDVVPYSAQYFKVNTLGNSNNGFLGTATPLQQLNATVGFSLKFTAQMLGWLP
jgi:hypothetical protein